MSEVAFDVAERLARGGSPSPGPEARAIVAHVLGVEPRDLIRIDHVTEERRHAIDALVERRVQGEPVQHLTGRAYFRYESLSVGPGVFIPRPETEELAGWAIARIAERPLGRRRVVELCAGSGAIAAAILREVGGVELHAVERSPRAFEYLRRNLGDERVNLVLGDMADALPELDGTVDVVVANPPYVPETHRNLLPSDVVDHDPHEALFAGTDGLDALRLVIAVAGRLLAPGGYLATEHDESHAPAVAQMVRESGFATVETHADLAGRPRFVTAVRVAGLGA